MIRLKPLVLSLLISLGTGSLSGFLTRNAMRAYRTLVPPPYAPPLAANFMWPFAFFTAQLQILYLL